MSKLRGNRTLTGTWGEIWVDGELIAELSKIEVKVSANREDVQLDIDVDSKMTGIKGEFTLTIKKAYTRYNKVLESWKKGDHHQAGRSGRHQWSAGAVQHQQLLVQRPAAGQLRKRRSD